MKPTAISLIARLLFVSPVSGTTSQLFRIEMHIALRNFALEKFEESISRHLTMDKRLTVPYTFGHAIVSAKGKFLVSIPADS